VTKKIVTEGVHVKGRSAVAWTHRWKVLSLGEGAGQSQRKAWAIHASAPESNPRNPKQKRVPWRSVAKDVSNTNWDQALLAIDLHSI